MVQRTVGRLSLVAGGVALVACFGHEPFERGRACTPGEKRACYGGPPETEDVGPCVGGEQVCNDDASGWGPCAGEVTPKAETCATDEDDDCDGKVNEDGEGCSCAAGSSEDCYEGPDGTEGVGACIGGTRTCGLNGMFGVCEGQILPADEDCDAAGDEDCDGTVCSAPIWGRLFGDPTNGGAFDQSARAVAMAPDGSLFVAIDFAGSLQIGEVTLVSAGMSDVAVAKLSPTGGVEWAVPIGGEKDELTGGLAVGADGNPILFGTFYSGKLNLAGDVVNDAVGSDAFAVKLGGQTGAFLWGRRVGVSGSFAAGDVAVAPPGDGAQAGDVILAGTFSGTLVCSGPSCVGAKIESSSPDAFVQRFSADGSILRWTKTAGGPQTDGANGIAVDGDGAIVVGGFVAGAAAFDTKSLSTSGPADVDAFVAKLTKDGELLWAVGAGDTAYQSILRVAVGPGGSIAVAGRTDGALDLGGGANVDAAPSQAFVAKLAPDAAGQWAHGYPGQSLTYARGVAFDMEGNVLVSGRFQGETDFGGKTPIASGLADAFVLKLDASGAHRWARAFGATDKNDLADAVLALPDGEVFFAGSFAGKVDFGLGPLNSAGALDAGLALFQP